MCVFETRTATGKEHFMCQDSGVSQIYILIISDGEKILSNVNVVVWRRVRRENSSLPVAVCVSKTRLLTLPIYILARMTSICLCWCTNVFFFCRFLYFMCECGMCQPMPTVHGSVCCREIGQISQKAVDLSCKFIRIIYFIRSKLTQPRLFFIGLFISENTQVWFVQWY